MQNEMLGGRVDAVNGSLGQAAAERISGGTERLNALIVELQSKLASFVLLNEETGESREVRKSVTLPPFFAHLENMACENDKALNGLCRIVSSIKM